MKTEKEILDMIKRRRKKRQKKDYVATTMYFKNITQHHQKKDMIKMEVIDGILVVSKDI